MLRIVLFILLFIIVIIAMAIMLSQLIREAATAGSESGRDLPNSIKRVAYVALILLMLGICAGALGGL